MTLPPDTRQSKGPAPARGEGNVLRSLFYMVLIVALFAFAVWWLASHAHASNFPTMRPAAATRVPVLPGRARGWVSAQAESQDNFDCKGAVAAKMRELLARGVAMHRMQPLVVATGRAWPLHLVLQVDNAVFDPNSPWPMRPSDYRVIRVWPAEHILASIPPFSSISPEVRAIHSTPEE